MNDLARLVDQLRSYKTEREWFEFKKNRFEPVSVGEYVSAIANSAACAGKNEGYVVWGINDKTHEIEGTTFDPNCDVKNEPLKHFLARQLAPDVNFEFKEATIEGKRVVVLIVPAAKVVPTAFRNERFIRIGSSKENIRKYPEKESFLFHVLRHGFPTIENTPSDYQDLTFEKLLIYYGAKGLKLNPDTFEKNLKFRTEDGKYNILAQLLSDDSHMPIRVAIFEGETKASRLFSVREFGYQCLLYSLDAVLRYADVLNLIQADERGRIVERKETPLFENDAFREAIVNAFVHNAWVEKNEPMFTVYSNRIEILSHGSLAPKQTIDGFFRGVSIPVNQKLAEIFLQLHVSEKTGRGVPTITKLYGKEAYNFRDNAIVVTVPFNWIHIMSDESGAKKAASKKTESRKNKGELNKTQLRILAEIRNNPNVTRRQLILILPVGDNTIYKGLSVLKKRGYIERVGSKKSGYWKVNDITNPNDAKDNLVDG